MAPKNMVFGKMINAKISKPNKNPLKKENPL